MKKGQSYWLILFVILVVAPLFAGLIFSLMYSVGIAGALGKGFTIAHWAAILGDEEVFVSIGYSILIGALSIGIAAALALYLVARFPNTLSNSWPGLARYLPLCIPPIAAGFFSFQFLSASGWFSSLLIQLGIIHEQQQFPELVQDRLAIGIMLTHILLALPFFLLLLGSLFQRLQIGALLKQAQGLGANPSFARRNIAWPILSRAAFPTFILYTVFVAGAYEIPLLLGRQSPQMVSVLTVRYLRHYDLELIPQAYITAILYAVIVLGVLLLTFRRLIPPKNLAS